MILKNAEIYNESFERVYADIEIENGIIKAILAPSSMEGEDYSGCVILPGFVDIHTHGCCGRDMTDGNEDSVLVMSEKTADNGVTSFCPTSMTLGMEELTEAFTFTKKAMGKEPGARILGINMEGPFISKAKKGAQAEENILAPDAAVYHKLADICKVCLCDIAPECEGADEFIREISRETTVSAAHTTADYETGMKAFSLGINHVTHLYNAMTPIASRAPGLVGAVMDSPEVFAEIICDGIHIHPAVLRMTFGALGEDSTCVISDSMMAAGMPDGEYSLGGQKVFVNAGKATLADGTVAGSTTNIFSEFKNLLSFGISEKQAVKSCTINPARSIGEDKEIGSIAPGKRADFVILSSDLQSIKAVYIGGEKKR